MKSFLSQPNMRLVLTLMLTFAVMALFPFTADATFLTTATQKISQVHQAAIGIVYTIGGLGLIVLAIFAFFGRFKWTYFFALAGGIFLVAVTNQLIVFLNGKAI